MTSEPPLSDDAVALREVYAELCELHLFLQGYDAHETGELSDSFDTLVARIRDNALAVEQALQAIEGQTDALSHLKALIAGWEKVEPHVNSAIVRTRIEYTGPTDFADALAAARAYVREGAQQETWESMFAWAEETFGPISQERTATRANEEMQELLADPSDVTEAADVCIALSRYPGIRQAIERKMAINRARKWKLNGDGTGYHVKDREGGA